MFSHLDKRRGRSTEYYKSQRFALSFNHTTPVMEGRPHLVPRYTYSKWLASRGESAHHVECWTGLPLLFHPALYDLLALQSIFTIRSW